MKRDIYYKSKEIGYILGEGSDCNEMEPERSFCGSGNCLVLDMNGM